MGQKLPPPQTKPSHSPKDMSHCTHPAAPPQLQIPFTGPDPSAHTSHTRPQSKFRFPGACAHTQYTCHPEMVSTLSSKTQPCAPSAFVPLPGTPDLYQLLLLRSSSPGKGRVPAAEQGSDTDGLRLCFHFKYTFRQLMPPLRGKTPHPNKVNDHWSCFLVLGQEYVKSKLFFFF